MDKWIVVLFIVAIFIFGFIKIFLKFTRNQKKLNFTVDFINTFRKFGQEIMNDNYDNESYEWLKRHSYKMQTLAGSFGIAQAYKPAFANYQYTNYQIIVNGISEIRSSYLRIDRGFGYTNLEVTNLRELIMLQDDVLLTYSGHLENASNNIISELKNPLIWFREGIQFIITLPISIAYWAGIMKYTTYYRLNNNFIIRLISFIVGFIALISSIITIITGYKPFINLLKDFFELG